MEYAPILNPKTHLYFDALMHKGVAKQWYSAALEFLQYYSITQ